VCDGITSSLRNMNVPYDPCGIGAITVLVIYGIGKFVALVVSEYQRVREESAPNNYGK
jgi:hypothetical protein